MGLHDDPNKKFLIKIDAEAHKFGDFRYEPEIVLINKFEVFTSVNATPASIIFSTKLCSILERSKGRDFYDIITLAGLHNANEDYIAKRFEFGQLKEEYFGPVHLQEKVLTAIADINWNDKVKDLERFLFDNKEAKKLQLFNSWVSDKLFFKAFGLTYENRIIIDTSLKNIIKLRLNHQNPRYEISIRVNGTKKIILKSNRTCHDVKAGFKSTTGSKSLKNLKGIIDYELDYTDKTKSIFCLELNDNSSEPVNMEVQFVQN